MTFGANWGGERLVQSRVARSTGFRVDVIDGRDRGEGWETICCEHGGVCSHDSRALAVSFAACPEEWCEDCMHGPGTLAGTNPDAPGALIP